MTEVMDFSLYKVQIPVTRRRTRLLSTLLLTFWTGVLKMFTPLFILRHSYY